MRRRRLVKHCHQTCHKRNALWGGKCDTYFPKCLAKVLGKAIVQNRIRYAQISVCQHMTKNLYGYRYTCCLVQLERFQHENNLQIETTLGSEGIVRCGENEKGKARKLYSWSLINYNDCLEARSKWPKKFLLSSLFLTLILHWYWARLMM